MSSSPLPHIQDKNKLELTQTQSTSYSFQYYKSKLRTSTIHRDTRLFISLSHIQADSNFHQTLILPVIHSAKTDRSLENIRSYRHTLLVVNSINSNPCLEQLRQHAQKIPVIHCTTTHRSLKHVRPYTQAYHINCTTTHPSLELHRRHTQKIPVIHMTTTRPR